MTGHWTCRQHGDSCKSYVNAGRDYNKLGVTLENLDLLGRDELIYIIKCLKWVEERGEK